MANSEIFSLFVDVVFCIRVVGDDPRVIARLGTKLIAYENYGKSEVELEPDGDKKELTPLGYYGFYVAKNGSTYRPYSLGAPLPKKAIEEFKDYYGFGAYRDENTGVEHFVLLIEDILSDPESPDWYFVNNFVPDSESLDFPGDAEITSWQIEGNDEYIMQLSDKTTAYIAESGAVVIGRPASLTQRAKQFDWTRHFEDSDSDIIVGKNAKGVFLIDRTDGDITDTEKDQVRYYLSFVGIQKSSEFPLFVLEDFDGTIVLLDGVGSEIALADFESTLKITGITVDTSAMTVTVSLAHNPDRVYPLLKKPGSLLGRIQSGILQFVAPKK
jgi:hypothetical protein